MYAVWHIGKKSLQNKQKFSSTQMESTCGLLGYPYGYIIYIHVYTGDKYHIVGNIGKKKIW